MKPDSESVLYIYKHLLSVLSHMRMLKQVIVHV